MSGLVYAERGACCGHDDGVPCNRRSDYLVKVKGCVPCRLRGLPRCITHESCSAHAADLRAGRMRSHVDATPVTLEQLRSLPRRQDLR